MIWGKTAKVCSTVKGMDNGVPTDLEGGFVQELVNLEDTEEHGPPPFPDRQVPPFASNLIRLQCQKNQTGNASMSPSDVRS
jgi:hypothetical protein